MKKNNKSKLNKWKTNLNNRLYFFTSILILITLFVVVIYFTKQPITAGKAWSVLYKGEEGTFPLTITFTKDDSGVLTKEAPFFDGLDEFTLSFGDIVDGKVKVLTIVPKVEEESNVCGNGVCDSNENSVSCLLDCPSSQPCGNSVCETESGEDTNTCPTDCNIDLIVESTNLVDDKSTKTFTFSSTIKNIGTFNSPPAQLTFGLVSSDASKSQFFQGSVSALSPQTSTILNMPITFSDEDYNSYSTGLTWKVIVDSDTNGVSYITESNELNNEKEWCLANLPCYNPNSQSQGICDSLGNKCILPEYDLYVDEVGMSIGATIENTNELTNLDICVGNNGKDDLTDSFDVDITTYVDNTFTSDKYYNNNMFEVSGKAFSNQGSCVDVGSLLSSVEVYTPNLPYIYLKVAVDITNKITETNEQNNVWEGEVYVLT